MAFKVIVVLICMACCVMAFPAPDNDKTVTGSEAVPAVPSDAGTPPKDLDTAGTFYAGIGVYPSAGYGYGFPGYGYGAYGGFGGYGGYGGYGYGYRYPGYGRYGYGGYGYPYY